MVVGFLPLSFLYLHPTFNDLIIHLSLPIYYRGKKKSHFYYLKRKLTTFFIKINSTVTLSLQIHTAKEVLQNRDVCAAGLQKGPWNKHVVELACTCVSLHIPPSKEFRAESRYPSALLCVSSQHRNEEEENSFLTGISLMGITGAHLSAGMILSSHS